MINMQNLEDSLRSFKGNKPFDHCIVEDFFEEKIAISLSEEFIDYNSDKWFYYKNPIENKKALNDWNIFPNLTYKAFALLQNTDFLKTISNAIKEELIVDHGLHGGGWHMHANGGNLNPHLDYSIHPKLGLQRKLNIIIYLSQELDSNQHGGHLGLWSNDKETNQPDKLVVEIEPLFNRAVIFDTTQMSWHGMSRMLSVPDGVYRKSLAIYYLIKPSKKTPKNNRALFAPRENQKGDKKIEEIIKKRSNKATSSKVYKLD